MRARCLMQQGDRMAPVMGRFGGYEKSRQGKAEKADRERVLRKLQERRCQEELDNGVEIDLPVESDTMTEESVEIQNVSAVSVEFDQEDLVIACSDGRVLRTHFA